MENYNNELYHFGVKGMKWGVRRAQQHVSLGNRYHSRAAKSLDKDYNSLRKHGYTSEAKAVKQIGDKHRVKAQQSQEKYDAKHTPEAKAKRVATAKKVAKGAAITAGLVAGAYGAYKLSKCIKNKKALSAGQSFVDSVTRTPVSRASVTRTPVSRANVNVNDYMRRYEQVMNTFGSDGTNFRKR